jgi:branched-chain amino acid transport system substrate-binding protein
VKRPGLAILAALVIALAAVASGCGGGGEAGGAGGGGSTTPSGGGSGVTALPASSCTALEYEGPGQPDVLIVSDLPMQGPSLAKSQQMVDAIRYMLKQANYTAGNTHVAFQACDDSTAQAAKWDPTKCSANANAYAADTSLVAVIGTYNSGCAEIINPIINQASGGSLSMVSPGNTLVCLTTGGGGSFCQQGEPDKYYPTGTRNYFRVVAHDGYQGAADAEYAQQLGAKDVYVLDDAEAYGQGIATNFENAAKKLGMKIAGTDSWDGRQANYEALMQRIKATGADAVFLGGIIDNNGPQLIKDKVKVLGPNDGSVKLLAPDGMTTGALIDPNAGGAGDATKGMYSSVAGLPADQLTGAGKTFVDAFEKQLGSTPFDPFAVYAAQAAQVVLDAIAKSDGTRAGVLAQLPKTNIKDGILGPFTFNDEGDPSAESIKITEYVPDLATNGFEPKDVVTPTAAVVQAAVGL